MRFPSLLWPAFRRTVRASANIRDGARRPSAVANFRFYSQRKIPACYPFRPYHREVDHSGSISSSSRSSPYHTDFFPHEFERAGSVGIRTHNRTIATRCDARKPSIPAATPEAKVPDLESGVLGSTRGRTAVEVGTADGSRALGIEEGGSEGGEAEGRNRRVEKERRGKKRRGARQGKRASKAEEVDEGRRRIRDADENSKDGESYGGGTGQCEEAAVAVIARVLKEKYGPQIVRGGLEEGLAENEEVKEEREEGEKEEVVGVEAQVEEGEEGENEEDHEGDGNEKDSPATTHRLTRARATTPSSLLSLYRFFSSHLGISSPSTVASLLAAYPALLRSNPTNDLLPHVQLLQSYGISNADIVQTTMQQASWLRTSLPQLQNVFESLLAVGVRRRKLGYVIRRGRGLLCSQPSSSNLDILVERAGVPVDKLGVIIEKYPRLMSHAKEGINLQLEQLSAYFNEGCGGNSEGCSSSPVQLKPRSNRQRRDKNHLTSLILKCPSIFSKSPHTISAKLSLLQSFTPPGTPSVAVVILNHAPFIFSLSSETLLAKLQCLVGLMGEEAAGRAVQSHPWVLALSLENVQGKAALLGGLIGWENAVRAMAKFSGLIASNEKTISESFRELVREVKELLQSEGREESRRQESEEIRKEGKEGGQESKVQSGAEAGSTEAQAKELVVSLVLRYPPCLSMTWESTTKRKVEYLKRDMGLSIKEVLAYPSFLGLSLDRRIRPRHVALLRKGYVVAPHEVVVGKMRRGNRRWGLKDSVGEWRELVAACGDGERVGEEGQDGSRDIEQECEVGRSGRVEDSGGPERAARMDHQDGGLQEARRMVCLQQFLLCTANDFEERFKVKL